MKRKKQYRRVVRWLVGVRSHLEEFRTEYTAAISFIIIIITPIIVLWCSFKIEVVQPVIGDVLSYYGVAFGILASVVTYLMERRRNQTEKLKELRPKLHIKLEVIDFDTKAYIMTIANRGDKDLREIWIDTESIGLDIDAKTSISVNLDCSDAENEWYLFDNDNRSIYLPSGKHSFPKTIGVCCTDESDTVWCIEFSGYEGACGPVYTQKDIYMI